MGDDENANSSVLLSMQIQLGEIKGILNTIVTEHARRIGDTEAAHRQLRFDLDSVKTDAKKDVVALGEKIAEIISIAKESGNKNLQLVNKDITTNSNNISELRNDMQEVKDKANASWNKILGVLALVVAGASFIWQAMGK